MFLGKVLSLPNRKTKNNVKRLVQHLLKFLLPLLFGIGIFWVIYHDMDLKAVAQVLQGGISWGWVAVSLVFALLSHVIRGLRWRLQIRTLGVEPTVHDMSVAVFGGYGLNLVFPRLGEIWRCNYIAHYYRLSFATTVGTMISERIVDMVMAGLMALLAFACQSHVFFSFFETHTDVGAHLVAMLQSPWLWIAFAVLLLLIWMGRRFWQQSRIYQYLSRLCRNAWIGIMSIRHLPNARLYIFYSVALWLAYYINSYTCIYFFDFTSHLTPLAALSIFIMGSLSLLLPVQGGLGAWHAMVIFTLGCYGIGNAEAMSFALVSWCIEQGFVLLLGVYAMVSVLVRKKQTNNIQN